MPEPRRALLSTKEYHPPLARREGMRLDFNENTSGCSPRVVAKLRNLDAELLAKYPEREPVEAIVAEFLGLFSDEVLLTNGVDEAIHLLCQTYVEPEDEVIVVVPTFSMYEVYASVSGAKVITVPAGADFAFPLDAVLATITPATKLIAVANPNNPTGTRVDDEVLIQIATSAPGAAVLVDEAYYEFCGKTILPKMAERENIFLARTFSKAYGLAGLRVGVLAGQREAMRMVRRSSSPYNVNAVALSVLPEALSDRDYIIDYVAEVRRSRARLEQEFEQLGIKYWPSEANFVLARFGDLRTAVVDGLRRRGILVRDRHSDPGCAGCVRITAGTTQQTNIFLRALREVLQLAQRPAEVH